MKRLIAIFIILSATTFFHLIFAQNQGEPAPDKYWTSSPILNLEPGKKIMKVQDLDLPDNISLQELLQMFPELVKRDDEDLLQNFDIQVSDISSGNSREILLTQLRARDIEKIELSINPTASSQINGQGGVINVILRKAESGFNGSVMLEASSTWDVNPAFKFSYKKDKLMLRGMASGEYYQPRDKNAVIQTTIPPAADKKSIEQYDDYKYGIQFANIHMEYKFDTHHLLKAWVWESYAKDSHHVVNEVDDYGIYYTDKGVRNVDEVSLYTGMNYKYTFDFGCFETEMTYKYNPGTSTRNVTRNDVVFETYDDNNKPHALNYFAKGKFQLIPVTEHQKCELTVGFNMNYAPKVFSFTDILDQNSKEQHQLIVDANTLYLSPYVEVNAKYGPCFIKGGVRYQYYLYDIAMREKESFQKPQNKVTGFINFGWQIVPHHHLSLILDKSLKRPDCQQVYPYIFYDPESGKMIRGNRDLNTEDIYTASLDYQYDFSKNGHTVLAGAGVRYNHINAVIAKVHNDVSDYINNGSCDVINATMMGVYGHGPFKIFLTGNLLQNWSNVYGKKDSNFSYNLSLTPMLSFKEEWRVSGIFEYNSNVKTMYSELGHYFYSEVRLSKGFNNWNIYLKLTDNFHRLVHDVEYSNTGTVVYNVHYLHFPGFGLGASWIF